MYNSDQIVADEIESGSWFESLICDLSSGFINLPIHQLDPGVHRAQRTLCAKLGLDWSTVWQKSPERPGSLILTHVYQRGDAGEAEFAEDHQLRVRGHRGHKTRGPRSLVYGEIEARTHLPWVFEQLERGKTVIIESVEDLPASASREKQMLLRYGMKSVAVVPLWMGREWLGCLSFAAMRCEKKWPLELVKKLELVGNLFSNAMARKLADTSMRENAARLQTILDATTDGIITIDAHGRIESVNTRLEGLFGYNAAELIHQDIRMLMPGSSRGEDVDPVEIPGQTRSTVVAGTAEEMVGRRKNGSEFPIEVAVSETQVGPKRLYLLCVRDISERKEAENAARDFAGRLINAQEQERARLARDLHDDVTQRLARLAIDAGKIENSRALPPETEHLITGLREGLARLSGDVHAISYELHPSAVIDLGLVDALRAECEQISSRHSMTAKVTVLNLPPAIPSDTAIGFFRIAQESLRNAIRHGRATRASVFLWGVRKGLQLVVEDDGIGFDPTQRKNRPSLGLASMSERTHLLGGTFFVESMPRHGTTIIAWVPLTESVL